MLLNPYKDGVTALEGTPFVQEVRLMKYLGERVPSRDPRRSWSIQSFLLPVGARALGGLRAKLQDQKGFITFCNQRDLEVLLGEGIPGRRCYWQGGLYPEPWEEDWVGFYVDERDLLDDLYERELLIRVEYPLLPEGTSFTRLVHIEEGTDVEETFVLLSDRDEEIGLSPDPRYETVGRRWARVERVKVIWELV